MDIASITMIGNWKICKNVKQDKAGSSVKQDLRKVARTPGQWMTKEQHNRLLEVLSQLGEGA